MFWYAEGWFFWWIAFLLIFFMLPLGYGWGYRGWGPWYRRRRTDRRSAANSGVAYTPERRVNEPYDYAGEGWGWVSIILWLVLLIALVWLIAVMFA